MHINKKIENAEVKGKSLIFFLSNPEHNPTRNISCIHQRDLYTLGRIARLSDKITLNGFAVAAVILGKN